MQIINDPYIKINWDEVPITKQSGETGNTYCRTVESGNIRIRLVEYSHSYKADHWCCRGHVIHILDGEISFELKDGSVIRLIKGMSCCLSDSQDIPHKSSTITGAFLLIID